MHRFPAPHRLDGMAWRSVQHDSDSQGTANAYGGSISPDIYLFAFRTLASPRHEHMNFPKWAPDLT
jgi:hypothetical protein